MGVDPGHAVTMVKRVEGEVGAHFAEADDAETANSV